MGGPARAKLSVKSSMFTYSPSLVPSIKDKYLSSTPLSLVPEGLAPEGRGVGRSTPLKSPKRLVKPQSKYQQSLVLVLAPALGLGREGLQARAS